MTQRGLGTAVALAFLLVFVPERAQALQPLEAFIRSGRTKSPDNAEARANLSQQRGVADATLGRVLPGISARGNYVRNQYQSVLDFSLDPNAPPTRVTIQPFNQLTGSATLTVPLIDLAGFVRTAAQYSAAEGFAKQAEATALQVESLVVQNYFQLLANMSLVVSSERALEVARESLRLAQAQQAAGRATLLDVDRAVAEVERQVQFLATAKLQVALSARALESASGLTPESLVPVPFEDDLHEEPDLASFSPPDPALPSIAATMKLTESADKLALAQKLTLVPVVAGTFTESGTNASGFVGHHYTWQAGVGAIWQFDLTTIANMRAQDAFADGARAREQRVRLAARDAIYRFWQTVHSDIATSRSARAQAKATAHAARLAADRYQAGAATQLDLLQAERDAYAADVARIQSDADLANARNQLRLAAGIDPFLAGK
jgi:outer membrane protein TolC